jgi:prepilin-type N-terminal cleavage/methylation domain-containing protein
VGEENLRDGSAGVLLLIKNPQSKIKNRRRRAFTLNEVLIALGILAIGSVAVASLFPTAAFLQKEAVKETLRQNHTRSADAVLEGVGLDNVTMLEFVELMESEGQNPGTTYPPAEIRSTMDDPAYDVFALAEIDLSIWSSYDDDALVPVSVTVPEDDPDPGTGTPNMSMDGNFSAADRDDSYVYDTYNGRYADGRFPVAFRSLPTIQPAVGGSYIDREVFWVPLVRPGPEASEIIPDWSVYAFILQPPSDLRREGAYAMVPDGFNPPVVYPGAYGPFNDPDIVCANPDTARYFPKVFRVPATRPDPTNLPNLAETTVNLYGYIKPGEKVLGNNGKIYRVAEVLNTNTPPYQIVLNSETLYEPINDRDLKALWVAPAPGGINQDSPLADIRLLSNTVVRSDDF